MRWDCFAPAKVNLMLHVVGRLENGYHHLQSLITFVTYGDKIIVYQPQPNEDRLTLTGPFSSHLTVGSANSVLQAKKWFYQYFNLPEHYFEIELVKNLPIAAGIGGGTSDAAAMIAGLLKEHQLSLTVIEKQQLIQASGQLGADVPVCLAFQLGLGNLFWLDGAGNTELPHPLKLKETLHLLLINPGVEVNTAKIFHTLCPPYSLSVPRPSFFSKEEMINFLTITSNDLQTPARQAYPHIPDFSALTPSFIKKDLLIRQSGSGSTYFVLAFHPQDIQPVKAYLKKRYPLVWMQSSQTVAYPL